jgi:hypothetical protein
METVAKLLAEAAKIDDTDDPRYVRHVIKIVHGYFDPAKYYITTTKNFRLSRKANLSFIMKNRFRTCGSLSFITAVLLRKLGHEVRLIHGQRKKSGRWIHHAWIEVKLKDTWQPFDLFAEHFRLDPKNSRKISTHRSWNELKLK